LATLMPGLGLGVQDGLNVVIELVALGQHFVEIVLAQHRAQRRLRQLAGGHPEILHLVDRAGRIDDPVVDHRVDLHRDVVLADHVLAGHVLGHGADIHAHHLLDEGDQDDQARPGRARISAERIDHGALILAQNLDR